MSLWMQRGGRYGQREQKFFDTNRIYLAWSNIGETDFSAVKTKPEISEIVARQFANCTVAWRANTTGQFCAFVLRMKPGDWVVTPRKHKGTIAVGEITGDYKFDPRAEEEFRHSRAVKWLNLAVPRGAFDQDLLYSFGASMTICEIRHNNAEERVRAMGRAGWKAAAVPSSTENGAPSDDESGADDENIDLAQVARDQIAKLVQQRFKGHGMERLVAAILEAQGYTTHVSPAGADHGVDILAAPGALGFGQPRICIQVKSGDSAVDRPTLDQLIGVMQNFKAEQGLLVSWGGFRSSVEKETANQFFRVRLWDASELVDQLLAQYDRLPEDLRADLPLQRIWAVVAPDEES